MFAWPTTQHVTFEPRAVNGHSLCWVQVSTFQCLLCSVQHGDAFNIFENVFGGGMGGQRMHFQFGGGGMGGGGRRSGGTAGDAPLALLPAFVS
jgi:hypothetical protein